MDFFQHRYYSRNKILLTLIGQWPYQTTVARWGFKALTVFLAACYVIPQTLAIVKYRHDWDILLDCFPPLIFVALCFAKFITSTLNSRKMLRLLNRIRKDWQVWTQEPEVNILHRYAERARKMTTMYAVAIYTSGILFITQPVVPKIIDVLLRNGSEPAVFPFPVDYYHLDTQKYYFYVLTLTYVCISWGLINMIALDVIVIVYVQHCCGIFAALGHKLERVGKNERGARSVETAQAMAKWDTESVEIASALAKRDTNFENLASCVDRHNDSIEYAKLLEKTYTWYFFCFVGLNMLIISITGVQIVKKSNDIQKTITLIVFIIGQITHLYLESYMSQILMDHSVSVGDHIHKSKWYALPLQTQKLLSLMVMRCSVPCKLTAGKVADMSVETFGMFLKTSLSYFTILRSV